MPIITTNKLITIERHLAEQEHLHPEATGKFSHLMRDLTLAIRIISREVRRAGLNDILGFTETTNVHGEKVKKLDEFANDTIFRAMDHGGHLCVMASEESDGLIKIPEHYTKGDYVLVFDPLDGSSNIDVNAPIGTIFSIYKRLEEDAGTDGEMRDVLQPGTVQIAAGYALYGSSTALVYTTGNGVDVFTFDPTLGDFFLTVEKLMMPKRGRYYSINEGNCYKWSDELRAYIEYLKTPSNDNMRPYSARYIGTAVADVHRTLHYGGIFLYPADNSSPNGKLRLLYEVNPMAMLIEQAGGRATDGFKRAMEIIPTEVHQRAPIILGSEDDVLECESFLKGEHPAFKNVE
ncbi:MAG: class 1 fructose-bisphosphatase [Bacteroidota bacterium]